MCGRYRLSKRKEDIEEYFEASGDVDWAPRYNIAPSQDVGIIRQGSALQERRCSLARWGLIPRWAKDPRIGYKTINARAETVASRAAFSEPFKRRRCLIPADGFYEWRRGGKGRQPFHFGLRDDSLFAFAGLWDLWTDPGGRMVESCSIVTTTPNDLLADVHDRMPVILPPENYRQWLDPEFTITDSLAAMLRPFDAAMMKRIAVGTRVNSVANDDPECAAAVRTEQTAAPEYEQLNLLS